MGKFVSFGSKPNFVIHEPYELNSGEYLVETGTFVPLRTQLEEMKRAGVDLMAHRMAHSDYLAGQTVNLDEPFEDFRSIDEFDLDRKREFFLRQEMLAAEQVEQLKAKQMAEFEAFKAEKEKVVPDSASKSE